MSGQASAISGVLHFFYPFFSIFSSFSFFFLFYLFILLILFEFNDLIPFLVYMSHRFDASSTECRYTPLLANRCSPSWWTVFGCCESCIWSPFFFALFVTTEPLYKHFDAGTFYWPLKNAFPVAASLQFC